MQLSPAIPLALAALLGCGRVTPPVSVTETRKVERGQTVCTGVAFAVGCGDGKCNAWARENTTTCPSDCVVAKLVSYNEQTLCDEVDEVVEPTDTAGMAAAIRRARAEGRQVRVGGRQHTSNGQLCTSGIIVSTARMNHALRIEQFEGLETVVTEPGIRMGDLTDWLDARGRSLGFAVLGTRDPTIAGAIATGSHGSSPQHNSVVSNLVQSIELVDANGDVREYTRSTADPAVWKTLTASLGLAGVVTKLRLRIEPTFTLDVDVTYHSDVKLGLGDGPIDYVRECDYGQLNWFPGQRRVVKTCGVKTELPRQTGATNRLLAPDFSEWIAGPAERALQHGACRTTFNCRVLERVRYRQFVNEPLLYRKGAADAQERSFHNVVGAGNRMMSSELTEVQEGVMQHDFEFAIPAQKAAAVFAAARQHFDAEDLCFPLVGIFIRFSRVDDEAWLAHTSASDEFRKGDVVAFMEMPIYIPAGFRPERTEAYLRPYKAWVKRLIVEFGARPHWGKNDSWVFDLQDPARAYGARWDTFRSTIAALDPGGLFMNPWLKARGFGREKDATR